MALGRHSDVVALREQSACWHLRGGGAPIFPEYIRYLGALKILDLSIRNIVAGDRVPESRRAVEALDFVLGGRDIPINI
jgi:hypothetical protein